MAAGCSAADWQAVEERWTLAMYYAMLEHWKKNGPPVYLAVAGYLGLVKPERSGTSSADTKEFGNLDELENMFSGGMIN